MAQQTVNFDPAAGDDTSAALKKHDNNINDHEARIVAAKATADAALPKAGGTVTGSILVDGGTLGTVGGNAISPSAMTANTGNSDAVRWYVYRTSSGAGWDRTTWLMRREVDGFSQGGVEFGQPANGMAVGFNDGAGNYVRIAAGGNMNVAGSIVAGGTVTWSDETLKTDITPLAVKRGMALALAEAFTGWELIATGKKACGVTAQTLQKINDRYVFEMDYTAKAEADENGFFIAPEVQKKLGVDNTGAALEASMDNALDIADLKTALAAALDRIAVLEARTS